MTQNQLPPGAPAPRLCVIEKRNGETEYGYNLHAEKGRGQFVGLVDPGSPAERGGLVQGDRIFAVNGHSIIGDNHKTVVNKIKQSPERSEMLVISEEGAKWYEENNIQVTLDLPNIIRVNEQKYRPSNGSSPPPNGSWYAPTNGFQSIPNLPSAETPVFVPPPPPPTENSIMGSQPVPRLANLEKSSPSDEFGFNLHAERNRGHFIGTVDAGGIGERAGLQMGQRIVGVNGLLIYPNTPHKEVVALIKKSPLSTTLLVAPEDVDRWYRDHGAEYSFQNAERYGEQAENHHENHHTSRHGTVSHHENVPNKTNGFEVSTNVPALNPHSIQVNEERETTRTTLTTKTETTSVNSYQYKVSEQPTRILTTCSFLNGDAYNPYSAVGNDSDDLLAQVFSQVNVPVLNVQDNVVVTSHTREISEDVTSSASSLSSHRESAVDVPASHQYVPSYVSAQTQQTQYNHHESHQSHQQPSPISNGSSHGYNGGSTSGYEDDDIYHLSAKEARERLRQKHIKPHLRDMSLNEKYQLVSNM